MWGKRRTALLCFKKSSIRRTCGSLSTVDETIYNSRKKGELRPYVLFFLLFFFSEEGGAIQEKWISKGLGGGGKIPPATLPYKN